MGRQPLRHWGDAHWEDRVIWVSAFLRAAENNEEYRVGFYPNSDGFTAGRIVEAFRDTFNVWTRLFYAESPLPILRRIWNHDGEVEVCGKLSTRRKAQPDGEGELPRQVPI